jgi:hypothetical protein
VKDHLPVIARGRVLLRNLSWIVVSGPPPGANGRTNHTCQNPEGSSVQESSFYLACSWQSGCHGVGPLFALHPHVRTRTLARPAHASYWPLWVSLTWLTVGVLTVCAAAGCRRGVRALDTSPQAANEQRGTISGTIRGPEGTTAVEGRIVDLIDMTTNRRQRVTTDEHGGFSVSLDPGDYRVVLTLLDGEAIIREPGVIHVDRSDVDTNADFVIGTSRASRPRPAYKVDDGLGSPVA